MKRAALLALLAACGPGRADPAGLLAKLDANPSDVEALSRLAVLAPGSVEPLLEWLDSRPDDPAAMRAARAVLTVAGEPCAERAVRYLDRAKAPAVRALILRVIAAGRWRTVTGMLVDRMRDPRVGPDVSRTLQDLWAEEGVPGDPWGGGDLDEALYEEWRRWTAQRPGVWARIPGTSPGPVYTDRDLPKVRGLIEQALRE